MMKKNLDEMETFFSHYPFCFLVSRDGIIFLSSTPAMVLKSLWPLGRAVRETLIASRQFGDKVSETVFKKEIANGTEVTLEENNYFVSRKVIDSNGWSIVLLTPTDHIRDYKLIGMLATIFVCLLILIFSGIIYVIDRSKEAIRQSEESKRLLLHAAGDGIFEVDATGQLTFVNPAALRTLGFVAEEMLGQNVHSLIHHSHEDGSNYPVEDCPMYASYTKAADSHHVTDEVLWRMDGSSLHMEYSSMPITKDGKVMGSVVTFKDITARKQAEEALRRSETKFRTLYDSTRDALMLLDVKGFLDCNKTTLAIFGCATREEFCHKHPADLSPTEQPCGTDSMVLANQMIATAMEKGSIHFEWMHKRNDTGETFPADVLLTVMELDGKPVVQALARDITERKRYEKKLEYFAIHDQLTGLLNRHPLEDILIRTVAKAKRGAVSSILYMDLDNFKDVNDSVGHSAGDEVLTTLAGLLKDAVRTEDIVFRLGGDEFAVLLDGMASRESLPAAERLRAIVEAHRFELDGRVFPLSLSIGLIDIDGTLATGELLSQADAAMYRAKVQGKNRAVVA